MMRQALLRAIKGNQRSRLNLLECSRLILKRRHRHEYQAPRPQNPGHLADKPPDRRHTGVMDHLDGNDAVEEAVGIRQRLVHASHSHVRVESFGREPFVREPRRLGRLVQAVHRKTEPREVNEMPSGPASEIEDSLGVQARQKRADSLDVFVDFGEEAPALADDVVPGVLTLDHVRRRSRAHVDPIVRAKTSGFVFTGSAGPSQAGTENDTRGLGIGFMRCRTTG